MPDSPLPSARPETDTLGNDVLRRLRADIVNCVIKPGQKLRFEAMKETYGVSFSTMREALSRLTAERLVIAEGKRGFKAAPVSRADLLDLTHTRVLIERECLRAAIAAGNDGWEAECIAALHRLERQEKRLGERYFADADWMILHRSFHRVLAWPAAAPILAEIREDLFERAQRYRRISALFKPQQTGRKTEHRAILDAALARDVPLAMERITLHIRETTENVLHYAREVLDG